MKKAESIPSSETKVGSILPNQPEEKLTQIAKDIATNLVFTDRHIRNPNDLAMAFLPIALGAFAEASEEEKKDIGLIYEYYSQAGPGGCNGNPIFHSFKYLNQHDAKIVWEKVGKIEEVLKNV